MQTLGADYSHWDGKVDWDLPLANDVQFAFCKVGQGWGLDDTFNRNYAEASRRGISVGGYWYYDVYVPPLIQASRFFDAVKTLTLPIGLAADYEDSRDGQYRGWRNFAVFMQRVHELLSLMPLCIYTGYYYWLDHRPSPIFNYSSYKWFAQFPLWIAQYNGLDAPSKIPGPWTTWKYWQWTEHGDPAKYGTQASGCDLNYASDAVTIPDPTPPPSLRSAVTTGNLNVRVGPGTTYAIVGTLLKGTQVSIDQSSAGWAHIVATSSQPLTGWSSEAYLTYI